MNLKNKSGITLIALIVTIIVLIIIAGISIATLTSDNGILRQTNAAKVAQIEGNAREQVKLACSAMRLAVAEAQAKNNSYSAKANSSLIQAKLIEVLNADKKDLTGSFSNGGTAAEDNQDEITIVYEGDDYTNATNNSSAKITYTIGLSQKTVALTGEENVTLKDQNGNDVVLDIGSNEGTGSGSDEEEGTQTPTEPETQTLATPTIALSGDTLTIYYVANAETYDIYIDGELKKTIYTEGLSGVWTFGSTLSYEPDYEISQDVNFTTEGSNDAWNNMSWKYVSSDDEFQLRYYWGSSSGIVYHGSSHSWRQTGYETINFGTEVQPVSDEFYNWFTANATLQTTDTDSSKTTVDLYSFGLTQGTYSVTVIAKADGYLDSNESQSASYTTSAGYTVTIDSNCEIESNWTVSDSDFAYAYFTFTYADGSSEEIDVIKNGTLQGKTYSNVVNITINPIDDFAYFDYTMSGLSYTSEEYIEKLTGDVVITYIGCE